jgi:glycoside hydrolase-like protein
MRFHGSVTKVYRLILTLFFLTFISVVNFIPSAQAQNQNQVNLDRFDMLTTTSGWVLLGQQLFWTSDAGQTWNEIGPSIPSGATVQDVDFVDADTAWVLWTTVGSESSARFHLSHTNDHGRTWGPQPLALFESGEPASFAEKAEMGWFDAQRGWISVKQRSGSNFSLGILFTTTDGGQTWRRSRLPVADQVYFDNEHIGWATGGPASDQVFRTRDGGRTWQNLISADIRGDIQIAAFRPGASNGQAFLAMTTLGLQTSLQVYDLTASADNFSLVAQMPLDIQPGLISVSVLNSKTLVAMIPGKTSIVRLMDGQLVVLENMDGHSASITELDMNSLDVGWAKSIDSRCVTAPSLNDQPDSVTCSSATRFLHTIDGGITWKNVELPPVQSNPSDLRGVVNDQPAIINPVSNLGNSQVLIGQGFDACEIPTLSQMQTWWDHSPYRAVNLYVGGSSRRCDNVALNADYLKQLYQQGWRFIPTWVGPQAPCTLYNSRMSSDVTVAYTQGVSEANLAVERLAELGLTDLDKSGSVIYYDIEHYGTNAACRSAVNAFMNGWVSQIRTRGNLAGVYGSTLCNTGLSDFLNITNVPDVIWPARWYHNPGSGYYDPTANVWDLGSCIPNTVWSNHQRVRQYEGGHNESWGNLTLEIDSNALDGVVAIPFIYPFVKTISRLDPHPTHAATVDFAVSFSDVVTGVNVDDFKLTTSGVSGAFISAVNGSNTTYAVTVKTGLGTGTIRLDVADDDSIKDAANNPLGGEGTGNGDFSNGDIYTIDANYRTSTVTGNAGVAGATLSYTDGTLKMITADGEGNYLISLPAGWSGTVKPYKTGYIFEPVSKSYGNMQSNQTAQNYTAQTCVGCADVHITINGNVTGAYTLGASQSTRDSYPFNSGPVKVTTTNATPFLVAERDAWLLNGVVQSFSEMMGLPGNQVTDTYYFPWYNNVTMDTQLRFANLGNSTTNITVTIAGVPQPIIPLAAGVSTRVSYSGINNGPVKVQSAGGTPIIVAERDAWLVNGVVQSFSEMMGLPGDQLTDTYYFPWYNNVAMDTQLRFANLGAVGTTINVTIAGVPQTPIPLAAGQSTRVSYPGINNGPVKVQSTGGVPIIVAERDAWLINGVVRSFSEMMGLPGDQLTTTYHFPWYNNVTMDTQLRFANLGVAPTNITVKIAGIAQPVIPLAAGVSTRVSYAGINNGPVTVTSSGGVPIIAAERDAWLLNGAVRSFSEMMGLPGNQLATTYYFPWYNNLTMDTQLRFAVP